MTLGLSHSLVMPLRGPLATSSVSRTLSLSFGCCVVWCSENRTPPVRVGCSLSESLS